MERINELRETWEKAYLGLAVIISRIDYEKMGI